MSRTGVILLSLALIALGVTGCGGGTLIPKDLKDYLSAELKTERRNVDVTQPFRTTIIYKINPSTRQGARDAERTLVSAFLEFSRKNGVSDFLNDSLMFLVRLERDPDANMKWFGSAADAREVLSGAMTEGDFIERCIKEENWPEELG